jgi:hypothetical protein
LAEEEEHPMFRFVARAAVVASLLVGSALPAAAQGGRFALGFTTTDAPVGGRYWLNDRVGLDLGLGLETRDDHDKKDFALSAGLPVRLSDAGSRAHFNLRPGFMLMTIDRGAESDKMMNVLAQFEFEIFMVENFSVRASHGAALTIFDPAGGGDSTTDLLTTGGNLTSVGFFYYFD